MGSTPAAATIFHIYSNGLKINTRNCVAILRLILQIFFHFLRILRAIPHLFFF